MINNFMFRSPVRIVFGKGTIETLGQEVQALGTDKVLFVSDKNIANSAGYKQAIESLSKVNIKPTVFTEVLPEPELDSLDAGLAVLKKSGSKALIAMGGGSVMDTAKAFAALATNPGPLIEYEGLDKFPNPALPIITIPTTAGTGSEISPFSVMNDTKGKRKFVWGGTSTFARVAIVDPTTLLNMPPEIAAASGMDAFTHAFESYIARRASAMSEMYALTALKLIANNLPEFVANNKDLDAASSQFLGSVLACVAAVNSGLGIVHAAGHLLGSRYHLSHGVSCTILLSPSIEAMGDSAIEKFATVEGILNPEAKYTSKEEAARHLTGSVARLVASLGIETNLKRLGATRDDINTMVEGISIDPRQAYANSPKVLSNDEIAKVYECVLM